MSLNPVAQALDTGATAFAAWWRAWIAQFTQPQLLKLSEAYHGASLFHSSQMGGFARRTLKEPGPRVFLAVGYMNLAHARSLGYPPELLEEVPDIGLPPKLPETLSHLWQGRQPLTDASGVVVGPTGLFQAFTSLRPLAIDTSRQIPPEAEQAASQALGRHLRLRLAARGVDWLTELPQLKRQLPLLEDLLMGRTVNGDRLVLQLPQLAALADTPEEALWLIVSDAIAT